MSPATAPLDLIGFEQAVYGRRHEEAARRLRELLTLVAHSHGLAGVLGCQRDTLEADGQLIARLAAAISALFADPAFELSELGYHDILSWHRWLAAIFAASEFGHADHVLRLFNCSADPRAGFLLEPAALLKFCLLYGPDSEIPLDLDRLWQGNAVLAVGLAMALVSPRFLGSDAAHQKRELILPWLSRKLAELDSWSGLPENILHDVYMHCSYAHLTGRHDVKRPINRLIGRWLRERECDGSLLAGHAARVEIAGRPVMLVVLEWFTSVHSIYRTHSLAIEAARSSFELIGIARADCVDAQSRQIFDRFVPLPQGSVLEQLQAVSAVCRRERVAVIYMPSVGMSPLTIFLANWRLAPLQVAALGHPATTHAQALDGLVVEEDYIRDASCFTERLLRLPPDGMPYRPTQPMLQAALRPRPADPRLAGVVQIAVCAASMKLNPVFLATCAEIAARSKAPTVFHFLVAGSLGLVHYTIQRVLRRYLGDNVFVYAQLPYESYLQVIHHCDLVLNPFPFGNTNGVVDAVWAGRLGVCLLGREVFEAIDPALFRRMGWPDWLIARDRASYVEAACRLIDDQQLREQLQQRHANVEALQRGIFHGRPELLGELLQQELEGLRTRQ